MGNLIDYLHWRGDLSFQQDPFNDVDNLVLSMLSYVAFDGIVPDLTSKSSISVEAASRMYFSRPNHTDKDIENGKTLTHLTPFVLRAMAKSRRYGAATLSKYVNHIDTAKQVQFSALHIGLSDGSNFIAYRGTDDTLTGWREDCNLSLGVIPAQTEAVGYLVRTTRGARPRYRIGGQSKGGNLAVYAATQCPKQVQNRILFVYNNDGPGFLPEVLQSAGYQSMLPRMRMFLPEDSMVGMLFDHQEAHTVVESANTGLMQHDSMSWQVLGNSFVTRPGLSDRATTINTIMDRWIGSLSPAERSKVIDAIFTILESSGATTLEGISNGGLKSIAAMVNSVNDLDGTVKPLLKRLVAEVSGMVTQKYLPDLKKLDALKSDLLHRLR